MPLPEAVRDHRQPFVTPGRRSTLTCQVDGHDVRISSADRVVFPQLGVTKGEVAEYYTTVADRLFAAIGHRPTTLERWPAGVQDGMTLGEDGFYSKRLPRGAPDWVDSVEIRFPSGRPARLVCPTTPAVAVWAAQMGTITFHPWPVSETDVDRPDQLRLDFDPAGATTFGDAVAAALAARELLAEFGWRSFPKTSGGRGVHVFVPIAPRWGFIDVRHAVIGIGRELERRHPDLITTSWWKEERGDRVFIDFNQAARDRTMASAYSIRANARATVSMPVTWETLPDVEPSQFTVRTVPELLGEPDPWADITTGERADLSPALDLWEADCEAGRTELPYPPDYPKMPGEPPRVQPSRRRAEP